MFESSSEISSRTSWKTLIFCRLHTHNVVPCGLCLLIHEPQQRIEILTIRNTAVLHCICIYIYHLETLVKHQLIYNKVLLTSQFSLVKSQFDPICLLIRFHFFWLNHLNSLFLESFFREFGGSIVVFSFGDKTNHIVL